MSTSRWVVIPDLQVSDHDQRVVDEVIEYIAGRSGEFTGLLCVGDELDSPEPSRWNKGYAGEFAPTLQKSIDKCHTILERLHWAVGNDKPFHLMRSNHGERIQKYISRFAPALKSLKALEYQELLGFEDIGVTYHTEPFEFAPNWVLAHGDEGSLIQTAGGTAMGLAKKWGKSVVCGHTHKAGLQHHHQYLNSRASRLLFGMEVGHLMSMKKAGYLSAGSANWQQALGVITVDGRDVRPSLVPIINGKVVDPGW